MSDGVQERIVRNNHRFREANEKIRAKADEYDASFERVPFLCECPVPSCTQVLLLTLAEYEGVRQNPDHFFTAPGHEQADAPVGHVVTRADDYVVVEKDEDIGEQ